ncbi:MAG TPA: SIS domain-containing protein [Anaerolineae bacterium]|nr:SIS domain-containing protein [Anaerolineae bacterium]
MNSATTYFDEVQKILDRVRTTQLEALERAADICVDSIASGGLVHAFGTGHSRIPVEEMFPRHGSYPGFHPIVELSLTYHNPVVGANGQRQAMFLEHVEGLGEVILRNFVLEPPDCFLIFSNSGINEVVVEVALGAKRRGLPVIAVMSLDHCLHSPVKHSSGKRLPDVADVVLDNGTPGGDALVKIEGLEDPIGPGSTIGHALIANALKVLVADQLTRLGKMPPVLTSSFFIGDEASAKRFDECYDDYRSRVRRVYGCGDD